MRKFFQDIQRQGKYPFLIYPNISNANTPDITIDNLSELTSNIFKNNTLKDITNVTDNKNNNSSNKFKEIKLLLHDVKEMIDEQEMLENQQWIQAVTGQNSPFRPNFKLTNVGR
ncbi:hypothetical protein RhiirA4_491084, partial [Rhizophagus irregularis]